MRNAHFIDDSKRILKNAAHCLKCNTTIESKHRHDYVTCECGDISVDGGTSYIRRAFAENAEWEELNEYAD